MEEEEKMEETFIYSFIYILDFCFNWFEPFSLATTQECDSTKFYCSTWWSWWCLERLAWGSKASSISVIV